MRSIDIIHAEHRACGAVLQALGFMLDGIRDGKYKPDFELLAAMIEYITEVPDKLHHPKEDEYLFVKIRQRVPQAIALLDKLIADHAEGARRTHALRDALVAYEASGDTYFSTFESIARTYIKFSWNHIALEERELLPMAEKGLNPSDWADIDEAFEANRDPWSGPTGEFQALFSRIVSMVPAPYGLGS
ncbi:hemerythrin domain-containing protein [Orrella sp. NBD-18]|uniref:Hemerythrin domain-containing protein n=1 Tax=Sheuella amnicola TaxID=2707330 RepID=A0A6B2QWX1_9BURK|nr:hemerythrin domain-containing protein [Sheuella amnicola]NDY81629.1 hemerythrin domain-containing protein [Sheuella amnicola]HBI83763.1 hemerythrin [Alcaligenaceae bacterium]